MDTRAQLQEMNEHLHRLIERRFALKTLEERKIMILQQIEMVSDLEKAPSFENHPLASVYQRYSVFKRYKDDFQLVNREIEKKIGNYETLISEYKTCTRDSQEINTPSELLENEFEIVKDFLLNSNQNSTFFSGLNLAKELDGLQTQHLILAAGAVEIVKKYSEIAGFLPPDYQNYYCAPKHLEWLRHVAANQTVEACQKIVLQYQLSIAEFENHSQSPHIFSFAYQMQGLQNEATSRLQGCLEELKKASEALAQYKEAEKSMMAADKKGLRPSVQGLMLETVRKSIVLEQNNTSVDLEAYCEFVLALTNFSGTKAGVKFLKTVRAAYAALEGLHAVFYAQIVPAILRGIFSGDQTVLDMIADISSLYNEAAKAESDAISKIKTKHESLMKMYKGSESDGAQLLLEMNALFDDVELATRDIFAQLPTKFQNVDCVKQAQQILKCEPAKVRVI